MVSVVFKLEHRMTMTEAANNISSVVDSSTYFSNPAFDVPIFEHEIVNEHSLWDLSDVTFKGDQDHFVLQRIHELCWNYGSSAPYDIRSVQGITDKLYTTEAVLKIFKEDVFLLKDKLS